MPESTLTKVQVGQKIKIGSGETRTVKAACSLNSPQGRWMCVTHGEIFQNQLQKDSHISFPTQTEHQLAWICPVHGPEVP